MRSAISVCRCFSSRAFLSYSSCVIRLTLGRRQQDNEIRASGSPKAARAFPKLIRKAGGVIEGGAEDSTLPRRDRSDGLVARPSGSPDTTTGMRGLVRCRTEPERLSHCSTGSGESFSGAA